ncbi:hypothetical protein D3C76_1273610 [compost metagenome]
MLDHLPEAWEYPLTAVTLRSAEDDMITLGPGHQAGHQLSIDMEQRQPTKNDLATPTGLHVRGHRPCVEDLRPVATHRNLGQPGGTAGAEVRGTILRTKLPVAFQVRAGLSIHQRT